MISRIRLLRNIGQYDSVSCDRNTLFSRLTLIYAENGRGKTTFSSILRSLATGNSTYIMERHRLAAQHPPHVVVDYENNGASIAIFNNNLWSRTLPNIVVFDDTFIDQNVYSGLFVGSEHRQNLHELILGEQGVLLSQQLKNYVNQIELHNTALKNKSAAIPISQRGSFSVDDFCALPNIPNIDNEILAAERNLAAANERDQICNTPLFELLTVPTFNVESIQEVLRQNLETIDAAAMDSIHLHFKRIGAGAESWVEEGIRRIKQEDIDEIERVCPFCTQKLINSSIIDQYRIYFSDQYRALKQKVASIHHELSQTHTSEVMVNFERGFSLLSQRKNFWSKFCGIPDFDLDTRIISNDWLVARNLLAELLKRKLAAPLENMVFSNETFRALERFETHRQKIIELNKQLSQANNTIQIVKEQAETGNHSTLSQDVIRLKAIKARHTPTTSALCAEYLHEKEAKRNTEILRDQTKQELEQYRTAIFPEYQSKINIYLRRFNAGYRLEEFRAENTRGGPTCTYSVLINNTTVSVSGSSQSNGVPSFRNTLSAGDRNTLALAFFFASLEQDSDVENKVVVIDDPVSSLDEHRSLTTAQEIRRLSSRVSQVIVLSHSKPFLCRIWEGADRFERSAFKIARQSEASTICSWDISQDSITEHDKRHAFLRNYLEDGSSSNNREVASSIRPLLEAFLRVAFPEYFPPETLLGPFKSLCEQRIGTQQQILNSDDTSELQDIIEYANRFHHDTNPAWATEELNDGELRHYVERALNFAKR